MSEETSSCCCASCGVAAGGDIKLRKCTACYLVSYCGITCQKVHRKQHKGDCKKRAAELRECKQRAAELRDELLFKQPESSHLGDCPICMLPLPFDLHESVIASCCSKIICEGCEVANMKRQKEMRLQRTCPFCREPAAKSNEEIEKRHMKRVEMNDSFSTFQWGGEQCEKGNYSAAFEYWTKAAGMSNMEAHNTLAWLYREGRGVEKNRGKEIHHLEEAAIGGHPQARNHLGAHEWNNTRNAERAVKHWIIAAAQGHDLSMKTLMDVFKRGYVSKEDLADTFRAYQAAVNATKSPQRDMAEEYLRSTNSAS